VPALATTTPLATTGTQEFTISGTRTMMSQHQLNRTVSDKITYW
jgi:hypothetical protein